MNNTFYKWGWLVLVSTLLLLQACNGAEATSSKSSHTLRDDLRPLHDEIMAIHDEMMPKLSQITAYQTELRDRMDAIRGQEERKAELMRTNAVLADLNRAEDAMWSWMHGFGGLDSIPQSKQELWLKRELNSVEQMKDIMLSGIEKAEDFLK